MWSICNPHEANLVLSRIWSALSSESSHCALLNNCTYMHLMCHHLVELIHWLNKMVFPVVYLNNIHIFCNFDCLCVWNLCKVMITLILDDKYIPSHYNLRLLQCKSWKPRSSYNQYVNQKLWELHLEKYTFSNYLWKGEVNF